MAYIGKSPTGTGVRSRYYYTATGGETSLSGADDNSNTLVFSDGNYVDVSLNGIALVAGTDYNTSTANTIGGLSALSASDIVEVVVYDIFTVADTVSAANGGTFSGNVSMGGTLSVTGAATATGGLNVGTIKDSTGTNNAITINSSGLVTMANTTQIDVWRLNTNFTTQSAVITGWEQPDSSWEATVGPSMSESSGVFTFPNTGLYKITGTFFLALASGDTSAGILLYVSTDSGSTFAIAAQCVESYGANTSAAFQTLMNVTDASTFRVRLNTSGLNSGGSIIGVSTYNASCLMFERITDSQ